MKKSILLTLFIPFLAIAEDGAILKDNAIKEMHNDPSLKHLFDNSKFPVDDYIYKAGKREPNQTPIQMPSIDEASEQINNKLKNNDATPKPTQEQEAPQESMQEKIEKAKEELKKQNEILSKQIEQDRQIMQEHRIKRLIKDSILANRDNEIQMQTKKNQYGVDGFSNQKSIDVSTNEHKLFRMIRAGRMIPAILTTAISSDLSGIVTAQIEEDIYASMGKAVLIPRGSKAIGSYTSGVELGHERLEIIWREIITPQGVNILLTGAKTADNMGMSGAIGAVNNKYWERYGIAYGISTITNALLLGIASKIDGINKYTEEIYTDARSDINSVVQDMIAQQSKIKPTIEIKSGSRIFLVPTNHMWFAPPKNGEVLMRYFE